MGQRRRGLQPGAHTLCWTEESVVIQRVDHHDSEAGSARPSPSGERFRRVVERDVEIAQLSQALDDISDGAIVHHGYTDYIRDYEVIAYVTADPRTAIPPVHLRYLFKYCIAAEVQTTVSPDAWCCLLDERLIDREIGPDLNGFVWAVRWQPLYPGAEVVADSERARSWADQVGIPFHEVRFEMNAHAITLIFADLDVAEVREGYVPFTVTEDD
ncbi:hypothetical protein Strop_1052 [Salinispora tropica CNB-440]|uniref:YxiG-like domain-containing protein n=1 Tax=Salinispora tropica (strain ATCC BAA-916 / DSM 44818 / JCM 13857 / NBRC 105044 / CNB-440) TaxID=369723 RepID=A4X3S5_SALTO|nr:hypothetical protein Strop_1052 [Salinispora tropica CNB-440]